MRLVGVNVHERLRFFLFDGGVQVGHIERVPHFGGSDWWRSGLLGGGVERIGKTDRVKSDGG